MKAGIYNKRELITCLKFKHKKTQKKLTAQGGSNRADQNLNTYTADTLQ